MSYDFEVWTHKKIDPSNLCLSENWNTIKENISYTSGKWQITCHINQKVEFNDIPDEIYPLIPSIAFLHTINVEPISAPKIAIIKAKQLIKLIRDKNVGVSYDKQTEKIKLPTGYKKYTPPKPRKDKRFDRLTMTWYMKEIAFKTKKELTHFIYTLKKICPEALPKRYGDFEPPQYKLINKGLEHFIRYLFNENYNSIIWYPSKPIVGINLDEGEFSNRLGARFPHFEIEFDASILTNESWQLQIKTIWIKLSFILNPFYAEARILKNAISSRTTYYYDSKTEYSPTRSGFWMGVPKNLGIAIVLGTEYQNIWDEFNQLATYNKGLAFLECNDWQINENLSKIISTPPKNISQQFIPQYRHLKTGGSTMFWNTNFPEYWPFSDITDDLEIYHQYKEDDFTDGIRENKKWWQVWISN